MTFIFFQIDPSATRPHRECSRPTNCKRSGSTAASSPTPQTTSSSPGASTTASTVWSSRWYTEPGTPSILIISCWDWPSHGDQYFSLNLWRSKYSYLEMKTEYYFPPQPGQISETEDGSSLRYSPRTELDYGTLLCWPENELGRGLPCVFTILPIGPPEPPSKCRTSNVTYSSFEVSRGRFKNRLASWMESSKTQFSDSMSRL